MKRHLVLLLAATAVLMFGASACSSDRATGSGDILKPAMEPDSTRGDTTFYSYVFRDIDSLTPKVLTTFDGRWHFHIPDIVWKYVPVGNTIHVHVPRSPSAEAESERIAQARQIIADAGMGILYETPNPSSAPDDAMVFSLTIMNQATGTVPQFVLSEIPFLAYIEALDAHPEIFSAVYPSVVYPLF